MNVLALFHTASAQVEERIYGVQVGLSVYVGLVRASLQEKIPLLQNHVWAAVGVSLLVVLAVQFIIVLVAVFSFVLGLLLGSPNAIGRFVKKSVKGINSRPLPVLAESLKSPR